MGQGGLHWGGVAVCEGFRAPLTSSPPRATISPHYCPCPIFQLRPCISFAGTEFGASWGRILGSHGDCGEPIRALVVSHLWGLSEALWAASWRTQPGPL